MPVYCDVTDSAEFPLVLLIYRYSDEVRHDCAQTFDVVPFHPNYFFTALGIGELADIAEEVPVMFLQTREVKVTEDVAKQDEALELKRFQEAQCLSRLAHF
jgi:hypothetical protein